MNPLELVRLTTLMERTSGAPEIVVGLLDGPIMIKHPELAGGNIRQISGSPAGACSRVGSAACAHGTFVAAILSAKRGSAAPAICPGCTLVVRPIFAEVTPRDEPVLSATPEELAAAIIECITAGARVINLSSAFAQPSSKGERELEEALDQA